ncbi:MAG: hypothetical protein KGL39_50540 [Patescibacteria group bacterium]|nr:hypothetical protein [Patescibacteria group bacterium]
MTELKSLKEFQERMGPTNLRYITELLTQRNALLDDLIESMSPEPPMSWHKRLRFTLGNKLIEIGIKLGGYYPYD